MSLIRKIKLWLLEYSKIIRLSLLLSVIHVGIYFAFIYGFIKFEDDYVYYSSPVAQEIKDLEDKQGGFISNEQLDQLNKKMEADFNNHTKKNNNDFMNKTSKNLVRISWVTIFFSLMIWPFTYLFLSGRVNEILPLLLFPFFFSIIGLLPFLNIFAVTVIIVAVISYKKHESLK